MTNEQSEQHEHIEFLKGMFDQLVGGQSILRLQAGEAASLRSLLELAQEAHQDEMSKMVLDSLERIDGGEVHLSTIERLYMYRFVVYNLLFFEDGKRHMNAKHAERGTVSMQEKAEPKEISDDQLIELVVNQLSERDFMLLPESELGHVASLIDRFITFDYRLPVLWYVGSMLRSNKENIAVRDGTALYRIDLENQAHPFLEYLKEFQRTGWDGIESRKPPDAYLDLPYASAVEMYGAEVTAEVQEIERARAIFHNIRADLMKGNTFHVRSNQLEHLRELLQIASEDEPIAAAMLALLPTEKVIDEEVITVEVSDAALRQDIIDQITITLGDGEGATETADSVSASNAE